MTQQHPDDKDYNLNHFDFGPADQAEQSDEPFEQAPEFESAPDFKQRHEPGVSEESLTTEPFIFNHQPEEDQSHFGDSSEKISAPVIPQMASDFPPPKQPSRGSGASMATAFAVVAMLIAAGAVWLNLDQADEAKPAVVEDQLAPGYNTIINDEIRKLRERMAVVELEKDELNQKLSRQNELLQQLQQQHQTSESRIENLQAVVAKLSGRVADQAKTPAPAMTQTAAVKSVSKTTTPAPVKKSVAKATTQYELPAPLESLPAGAMQGNGEDWVINLVSVYSEAAADNEIARLHKMGIDAEIAVSTVNDRQLYRIRLSGFASRDEALQKKEQLASQYGIKDAWVHKP
ncbi:MAG: hypothetical protein CO187_10285 [Zetaproteobacteria bacterium CG_4_9_14_3_um_filter_53_7]|nr:MAG: hypothetical protein CO187_10285 [Zetaproteobacteria bacterium CG_4_9_14_3_um_filter_53_7]